MTAKRILIVDDDVDLCEELADALSEEGYDTGHTSDVAEAKRRIREDRYDILLLDYKMPGPGGIGILRAMRAENVVMTVLVISGRPFIEDELEKQGLHDMVRGILHKPVAFADLLEAIRDAERAGGD
jgi:two-component system OmpR family response regulator